MTMPQYSDALRLTRDLPVPLNDAELSALGQQLAARKAEKDTVESEKRELVAAKNTELKKITESMDKLASAINQKVETRVVDCEQRRDLETGETVVFRLDRDPPEEVPNSRKPYGQDEKADSPQASLFDAKRRRNPPPPAPTLRCNAINADGEIFVISAEQADAADREIRESGSANVDVDGMRRNVTKVVRGKACEVCGIVGTHRPECAQMKREEAGKVLVLDVDGKELEVDASIADDLHEANHTGIACECDLEGVIYDLAMVKGEPVFGVDEGGIRVELTPQQIKKLREAIREVTFLTVQVGDDVDDAIELIAFAGMQDDEDYDRNDTAQVAEKIAEGGSPPDGPVRGVESATTKVKPKRTKKSKRGAASAEVEH